MELAGLDGSVVYMRTLYHVYMRGIEWVDENAGCLIGWLVGWLGVIRTRFYDGGVLCSRWLCFHDKKKKNLFHDCTYIGLSHV